jgi:hypothetical protein
MRKIICLHIRVGYIPTPPTLELNSIYSLGWVLVTVSIVGT